MQKEPVLSLIRFTFLISVAVCVPGCVLVGQAKPEDKQQARPQVGPAAPQSRHYPVLLLAVGANPSWSLRLGPKGPERLDRPGYPPIALEPGDVAKEGATEAWNYHAKDTATGATVTVHVSREACSDATATKYSFRAVVDHAQLGTLNGCARIAAELFPRANNQDDDEDPDKKKTPAEVTTVTNFKLPVDVAYISPTKKVVLRHGKVPHIVAQEGTQLSLSHDGKRLLYTRQDPGGARAMVLYDSASGKTTDLFTGDVQQAFWSPDDTRIAFLKMVDGHLRLWAAPASTPETAAAVYSNDVVSLQGWADDHTLLVDDLQQLSWVGDDGTVRQTLPDKDLYGETFAGSSASTVRIHPSNPDLLLVSAEITKPASNVSTSQKAGAGLGFFLYEIHSKRRAPLSPADMLSQNAEWSRDGVIVFFTGTDATKHSATWRIFWDGSILKRYSDGVNLVIGQ